MGWFGGSIVKSKPSKGKNGKKGSKNRNSGKSNPSGARTVFRILKTKTEKDKQIQVTRSTSAEKHPNAPPPLKTENKNDNVGKTKTEKDKQIQVTGSASTEKHQNAPPPLKTENKNDNEGKLKEAGKSPIAQPAPPFRSRWVRGMQDPNRSYGSSNGQSPVTKNTPPASMGNITASSSSSSEEFLSRENLNASDLAKEFLSVDKSALDASHVTNSLLESSFTGPDAASTNNNKNARLEAAYMWTKREYNSMLEKIKDLEEAAAAREQAKVDDMMSGFESDSALKWAQEMIGLTLDSESASSESEERNIMVDEMSSPNKLDRETKLPTSQVYPTELNDLSVLIPTLSPTTINSALRTMNFEETTAAAAADTSTTRMMIETKEARPSSSSSSFRRMMLLFLLALACTLILSAQRAPVEFVRLKEAMSSRALILKEHGNLLLGKKSTTSNGTKKKKKKPFTLFKKASRNDDKLPREML